MSSLGSPSYQGARGLGSEDPKKSHLFPEPSTAGHAPRAPSWAFLLGYAHLLGSHTQGEPLSSLTPPSMVSNIQQSPIHKDTHTHSPLSNTRRIIPISLVSHSHFTHTPLLVTPIHTAGCHTHTCPVTWGPILPSPFYTPSCVSPTSPSLSLVIHPPSLLHTPPLMSLLHTSMCHTQPQPLWSHTHTLSLSHPLTSFSESHPTPATPVSHTLDPFPLIYTASSGSRPGPAHSASPTHPLACHTHPLMCHTLPQPSRG